MPTSALKPKGLRHNKNGGQNTLKLELPSRTDWTGSQPAQLVEKKSKNLPEDSSENKESKKKQTVLNSEPR